jgi:hypothetical protein
MFCYPCAVNSKIFNDHTYVKSCIMLNESVDLPSLLMRFGLSSINPIHANLQILPSYLYQILSFLATGWPVLS